jgi:hypothetical protein
MSSAAAAADAPEEFAALAEYAVDDFMSEAASDVEVFATTEGHGDVSAEEIRFLARDPHAHDRVISRVARLPRRALRRLLRAAGFDEPVWQTRIRRATAASLAEEVGEWYHKGSVCELVLTAGVVVFSVGVNEGSPQASRPTGPAEHACIVFHIHIVSICGRGEHRYVAPCPLRKSDESPRSPSRVVVVVS